MNLGEALGQVLGKPACNAARPHSANALPSWKAQRVGTWQDSGALGANEAPPEAARLLDLLGALSHGTNFSVGCYCENEARCHRSILRALLTQRAASLI